MNWLRIKDAEHQAELDVFLDLMTNLRDELKCTLDYVDYYSIFKKAVLPMIKKARNGSGHGENFEKPLERRETSG